MLHTYINFKHNLNSIYYDGRKYSGSGKDEDLVLPETSGYLIDCTISGKISSLKVNTCSRMVIKTQWPRYVF